MKLSGEQLDQLLVIENSLPNAINYEYNKDNQIVGVTSISLELFFNDDRYGNVDCEILLNTDTFKIKTYISADEYFNSQTYEVYENLEEDEQELWEEEASNINSIYSGEFRIDQGFNKLFSLILDLNEKDDLEIYNCNGECIDDTLNDLYHVLQPSITK